MAKSFSKGARDEIAIAGALDRAPAIGLTSARLIRSSSYALPDDSYFEEKSLEPEVSFEAADATRRPLWTSVVFSYEAKLPFTGKDKRRKRPAWTLDAAFFVVVSHEKGIKNAAIKEFLQATVVPLITMRFVGFLESAANLAGIRIQQVAAVGTTIRRVDFDFIDEAE